MVLATLQSAAKFHILSVVMGTMSHQHSEERAVVVVTPSEEPMMALRRTYDGAVVILICTYVLW